MQVDISKHPLMLLTPLSRSASTFSLGAHTVPPWGAPAEDLTQVAPFPLFPLCCCRRVLLLIDRPHRRVMPGSRLLDGAWASLRLAAPCRDLVCRGSCRSGHGPGLCCPCCAH